MYACFRISDCLDEEGINLAKVKSQADAIPYLVDLLDGLEKVEMDLNKFKAMVEKEFKAYGLEVQYFT